MNIVPIERIRAEVLAAMHGGADLEAAIHAAAVRLGLSDEVVLQALETEEQAS